MLNAGYSVIINDDDDAAAAADAAFFIYFTARSPAHTVIVLRLTDAHPPL